MPGDKRLSIPEKTYLKLAVECLEAGMNYLKASKWRDPVQADIHVMVSDMKDALEAEDPLGIKTSPIDVDNRHYHLGDVSDGSSYWAFWYIADGPSYRFELRNQDKSIDMPMETVDALFRHLNTHRGWMLGKIHK